MNLESPDSGRRPPLEPVLPLINVVFLLLIFFMVAGHLAPPQNNDVKAPHSASQGVRDDDSQPALSLKRDGGLFYRGQAVADADLPALIARLRAKQSRPTGKTSADEPAPVRLLADAGTPLKTLRAGLGELRDAGVTRVRLVTLNKAPGPGESAPQ